MGRGGSARTFVIVLLGGTKSGQQDKTVQHKAGSSDENVLGMQVETSTMAQMFAQTLKHAYADPQQPWF